MAIKHPIRKPHKKTNGPKVFTGDEIKHREIQNLTTWTHLGGFLHNEMYRQLCINRATKSPILQT
jgi:hypothetical protein